MSKASIIRPDTRVQQFCELIQTGTEAWAKAGRLLCKMLEEDPDARAKIMERLPLLTIETLECFERIGRKQLYPYLAVDPSPGARRLAELPYPDQERLYRSKVVVVVKTNGFTEQKAKRVQELNEWEARRVFNGKGVRTAQEQLALLNRPKRNVVRGAPRIQSDEEPESTAGTASLDAKPADELTRLLTLANDALLEARTVLATIKRGTKKDGHITIALREIGALRFAVNESEL